MAKCKCCGKEIQSVQVNFFNREGDDSWVLCGFEEYAPNAIELDVDNNWTGYELDEEEQRGTIKCPHCGKFPFEDEIQIYEIVRVVMFTAKGGGADEVSDEEETHTKICHFVREGEDSEGV